MDNKFFRKPGNDDLGGAKPPIGGTSTPPPVGRTTPPPVRGTTPPPVRGTTPPPVNNSAPPVFNNSVPSMGNPNPAPAKSGAMSLEEALQRANAGDAGAMVILGNYFYDKQPRSDYIDETEKWYRMAADTIFNQGQGYTFNYIWSLYRLAWLKWVRYYAQRQVLGTITDCREYIIPYYEVASELYRTINSKAAKGNEELIQERYEDAAYTYACYLFSIEDSNAAIDAISSLNTKRVRVLYANCLVRDPRDEVAYPSFWNAAAQFEHDLAYADAEKDYVEDIYWALCMLNIAIFLRMGLGGAPLSIERAYNVLKMTHEKTKNEGMKENISKELSHYKTGLFGGMKYVE